MLFRNLRDEPAPTIPGTARPTRMTAGFPPIRSAFGRVRGEGSEGKAAGIGRTDDGWTQPRPPALRLPASGSRKLCLAPLDKGGFAFHEIMGHGEMLEKLSFPLRPMRARSHHFFARPPTLCVRGIWCRLRDSNPRPPDYKSGALPAELRRPLRWGAWEGRPSQFRGLLSSWPEAIKSKSAMRTGVTTLEGQRSNTFSIRCAMQQHPRVVNSFVR